MNIMTLVLTHIGAAAAGGFLTIMGVHALNVYIDRCFYRDQSDALERVMHSGAGDDEDE